MRLSAGTPSQAWAAGDADRRCSRMGEGAVDIAERVVYAVVKES